jgi:hypothetical protein
MFAVRRKTIPTTIVIGLVAIVGVFIWQRPAIIGVASEDEGIVASNDFPVVLRTNGGLLEVATLKHRRTFNLTNTATVLGYKVPFCREKASYTADTYITYRVRLAKRWDAEYRNQHLYVTAPRIEPALPVAFDTSRLKATLDSCRFVPSMDTQAELLRSISGRLKKDALDPQRIAYVKDHGKDGSARDTVREFVEKWLVTQRGYNIPKGTPIDVAFNGD